jgi:Tfp pilus assembly PilM family ATPase
MSLLESVSKFLDRAAPAPAWLSLGAAGLDITDRAVRVVRLARESHGLVPACAVEVCVEPPPTPATQEAPSVRRATCKTLPEALALAASDCKLRAVIASIPERKTYTFVTSVPIAAGEALSQAIEFRVQENVPLPPDDVAFDYQVIGGGHAGHIDLAVTAVPRVEVDSVIRLVEAAGLEVVGLESEARALARALVPKGDLAPCLILNVEPTSVTAAIVERGVVQFSSILTVSGEKAATDLASPEAKSLREEVNQLLVYWFTGTADGGRPKIEDAILGGPYAAAPGLVDFLAKGLQIRVRLGDAWANCFEPGRFVPDIPRGHSFAFSAAAGLALVASE